MVCLLRRAAHPLGPCLTFPDGATAAAGGRNAARAATAPRRDAGQAEQRALGDATGRMARGENYIFTFSIMFQPWTTAAPALPAWLIETYSHWIVAKLKETSSMGRA